MTSICICSPDCHRPYVGQIFCFFYAQHWQVCILRCLFLVFDGCLTAEFDCLVVGNLNSRLNRKHNITTCKCTPWEDTLGFLTPYTKIDFPPHCCLLYRLYCTADSSSLAVSHIGHQSCSWLSKAWTAPSSSDRRINYMYLPRSACCLTSNSHFCWLLSNM